MFDLIKAVTLWEGVCVEFCASVFTTSKVLCSDCFVCTFLNTVSVLSVSTDTFVPPWSHY